MPVEPFLPGHIYENVYLIAVDAAGYSSIVLHNPRDHAARAFDLLRERIVTRLGSVAASHRCSRTQLWSWRGDGGILAVHDDDESVARDVALTAARDVLQLDLQQVREELAHTELSGDVRLRIAVHKGAIRYWVNGQVAAMHSPEINFAAHLEEATPPDCVAISEEVHRAAGRHANAFEFVGTHESHNVYLMTESGVAGDARQAWLASTGLTQAWPVFAQPQRPSQQEKARLVRVARAEIIDLGTALGTSSRYLTTTERPAHYRDAVLEFLAGGGTYRCVLLDPSCEATATISQYRQEDLAGKIRASIVQFGRFKQRHGSVTDGLHVCQSRAFPGFAAITIDLESPTAMILYSPYLMTMKPLNLYVDHGDSPHYLATAAAGPLLSSLVTLIRSSTAPDTLERVL